MLAIIITIMVLEMKTPRAAELSALRPLAPVFLSYVLSFLYLGIYWSNHHSRRGKVGRLASLASLSASGFARTANFDIWVSKRRQIPGFKPANSGSG